jgi:superfamily II DNA or RNA helicase
MTDNELDSTEGITPLDTVSLRPFQEDLARVIRDRITMGEQTTVAWVNAGSGKTLGWLHAANDLYRSGLTSGALTLVPRLTLRSQAELDWTRPPGSLGPTDLGGFRYQYGDPKMGPIVARDNTFGRVEMHDGRPGRIQSITDPRHFGYVTTYASLVADPGIHFAWARDRSRRFLLVCDEAQFLGDTNEGDEGGGTEAGRLVRQLMEEYALHAVLLTGTPHRSDRGKIVGAEYTPPDERRTQYLKWHVRATYRQGVAAGYLRGFQFDLDHGAGEFTDGQEFDIATLERHLGVVVRDPRVWPGLVDSTVERLRDVWRRSRDYRALLCCSTQDQAEEVIRYLSRQHPDVLAVLAISRQTGKESKAALDGFRAGRGDILVTVSKAYIGYDCKQITVVGLLTSRRWDGYLQQIVGRGLRVWSDRPAAEQTCYVVGPADPKLLKFCKDMRSDAEQGIRERIEGGPGPGPSEEVEVADFSRGGTEVVGSDAGGDADLTTEEQVYVASLRREAELHDSEGKIAKLLRLAGHTFSGRLHVEPPPSPVLTQPAETEADQRTRLGKDVQRLASRFVHARWPGLDTADFQIKLRLVLGDLNEAQGLPRRGGAKKASLEQMEARRPILLHWIAEVESENATPA